MTFFSLGAGDVTVPVGKRRVSKMSRSSDLSKVEAAAGYIDQNCNKIR